MPFGWEPSTASCVDGSHLACVDGSHLAREKLKLLQVGRMQSCVRPVCAVFITAGPNAIRGSGPNQKHALVVRLDPNGFSRPSVLDRFCITSQSLRQTRELLASVALRSNRGRLPIGPPMSQERPGDAGVLVGQCHGRDLGRLIGNQPGKPRVRRAVPLGLLDDRHGTSDE